MKGNLVYDLFEYWSNDKWIIISRQTNTYSAEGYQTSYLYQLWESSNWKDNRQGLLEYDSEGKLIFNTVKSWDGIEWINYSKVSYNYDLKGNRELSLIELWVNNQWVNSNKISYTYNSDNYFTYGLYEIWKNSNWVRGDGGISVENPSGYWLGFITCEIFAYYSLPTNVMEEEFQTYEYELFNNYPNPFNPVTKIKFTIPQNPPSSPLYQRGETGGLAVSLRIFDILGNEIATLVNEEKSAGTYEVIYNASTLSSGVYFYTLTAGEFSQTKKMILAK